MRIGTRWLFGSTPPTVVPTELHALIATFERQNAANSGQFWTLTWLEGRAFAELDDGTIFHQST